MLKEGQDYKGRPKDRHPLNVSISSRSFELMQQYSTRKGYGLFLSELIHEYHGRQQAQQWDTEAAVGQEADAVLI